MSRHVHSEGFEFRTLATGDCGECVLRESLVQRQAAKLQAVTAFNFEVVRLAGTPLHATWEDILAALRERLTSLAARVAAESHRLVSTRGELAGLAESLDGAPDGEEWRSQRDAAIATVDRLLGLLSDVVEVDPEDVSP